MLAIAAGVLAGSACGGDGTVPVESPAGLRIENIEPSSGTIGTEVVIHGAGFDPEKNDIGFSVSGIAYPRTTIAYQTDIQSPDGKTLRFDLPEMLGACAFSQFASDEVCADVGIRMPIGDVSVSVFNRSGTSNSVIFRREASPVEVAQAAVEQSQAYQELIAFLDQKVNDSCHPACGPNSASVSIGFVQDDNGKVYVDLSVHGVSASDLKARIPDRIAGYEVRLKSS